MIQTPVTASNENDSIFYTFFLQTYYLFAHVFTTVYAVRAVHDDESGCSIEDQIIIEMRTKKNGCRSTSACGQPKNPIENWQPRALLTKIRLSSMRSQTFHVYFFQSPFHIGEIIDSKSLESWDWNPLRIANVSVILSLHFRKQVLVIFTASRYIKPFRKCK